MNRSIFSINCNHCDKILTWGHDMIIFLNELLCVCKIVKLYKIFIDFAPPNEK